MTWKFLQLAFPLAFIGIALYIYCSKRRLLMGFREQLAVSPKGRRFVVLTTLLTLLVFHFVALCGTASPFRLLPSSIMAFVLFSQRCGEGMIRFFQHRHSQYVAFLIALAAFFFSQSWSFAATLMVLLVASWVFPTMEQTTRTSDHDNMAISPEELGEKLNAEIRNAHDVVSTEQETDDSDMVSIPVCEDADNDNDMEDNVVMDETFLDTPSEKAIRNQKNREREREHRRKRAKRRARRAKQRH